MLGLSHLQPRQISATAALDPITGMIVPLFHPRRQQWQEHFRWIENARRVQGLTPTGRATVERLRMNQERLVVARGVVGQGDRLRLHLIVWMNNKAVVSIIPATR